MRRFSLLLAIVLLGLTAVSNTRVVAMPTITLSAPSGAANALTLATVICGNNGCAPVQTQRITHHKKHI